MTTIGRCWMMAFGLTLMTAACGSSDAPDIPVGENPTFIKRRPTPVTEFTPVKLEATVDDLIAELNEHTNKPMHAEIVLKVVTGFFAPVATAANRAMGELGMTGNVVGSLEEPGDQQEAVDLQNKQIEQTVAGGAEAIGLAPFGDGNGPAIDAAVAKGIHVVTLDADVEASKRSMYVGTLSGAAGKTAGETLLPILRPPPGTVIIHGNVNPVWATGLERTQGAQDVFEKAGYKTVVSQITLTEEGDGDDATSMKTLIETEDPPVVGMIGMFNESYRCAMAVEDAGRTDIPIVAFDFDPKTVNYMRKGLINATHTQRQYYEGYLVPYILYGIENIGLDETKKILAPLMADELRVDTGIDVVTVDKLDAYNDFLYALGVSQ
ncbi:sugar ABC transporter [Sorangium cellulosum]|uniref:Sugar ABC transporter n=1 Tax=Sorangium cellulosum TaxID=56 RepID=A0A2L0F1W9_SORCE|nr:substrate-binding domain-containing protein [Sorangium cellulosum]AUX45459.1 sugar ABC transporter [Sorangium cellulosum]